MNIITIDPSLSCTAVVINGKRFIYTNDAVACTKRGSLKRWFNDTNDLISHRIFSDKPYTENHSELEIFKLEHYSKIVDHIIDDIKATINTEDNTIVAVEGYSYSSSAGPLIDLVTFGTLLRRAIYDMSSIKLQIYTPSELKKMAAKLTYPPIQKNKSGTKLEYRNNEGIAGGSFKKPEMYKVLTENTNFYNDPWVQFLRENSDEILNMKSIPKPIEDMNDAMITYKILSGPVPLTDK